MPRTETIQAWARAGIVCWLLQELIGGLVVLADEISLWRHARRQARR